MWLDFTASQFWGADWRCGAWCEEPWLPSASQSGKGREMKRNQERKHMSTDVKGGTAAGRGERPLP